MMSFHDPDIKQKIRLIQTIPKWDICLIFNVQRVLEYISGEHG